MARVTNSAHFYSVIFLTVLFIVSCKPTLTKITVLTKENTRLKKLENNDSLFISSISISERRCNDCKRRPNFPLAMTNRYGDKNLENLYRFTARFNHEHSMKIILPVNPKNDSLYYFSKQEWTRRLWGKKPAPNTNNGLTLVISHSFTASLSLSAGIDGGASGSGDIETIYEFVNLSQGKETNYISFKLTRGATFNNELIKYKDLRRIFKRLLKEK